jgi:hypothetical protein
LLLAAVVAAGRRVVRVAATLLATILCAGESKSSQKGVLMCTDSLAAEV